MKILHVIPDLKQASGPSAFCVKVCDQLAEEGQDVSILHGGKLDRTSLLPTNRKVQLVDDFNFFKRGALPDLVHIHSLWTPVSHAGVSFARRHKIPYVISAHGMLAPWALKHKWLKKRIAWWLYQKRDLQGAALLHVTAPCENGWFRDLGFKQPCVLAPLGSDLPDLNNAETQRPNDVKTVLFVGRVYPVKGLMNLVRAWARLKESLSSKPLSVNGHAETQLKTADDSRLTVHGIPWQLVIAGPDQAGHKADLVAEANKLGLAVADIPATQLLSHPATPPSFPVDIVFTGPVYGAEKDALYRMVDLFVLPSFSENFGVVVTDALSYGVPVITTKGTPWAELRGEQACLAEWQHSGVADCENRRGLARAESSAHTAKLATPAIPATPVSPANPATPDKDRCGWWIDIGVEPLIGALEDAMGSSVETRRVMGRNGRRLVETNYTWPTISVRMSTAYDWLVHGGPSPVCVITD